MSGDLIFGFETVSMFFNQMGIVAIVDREGKYLYVSDAWAKETKVRAEEAIGKTVFTYYPNSSAIKAMDFGEPLIAEPVTVSNNEITDRHFTSYFPIYKNGKVVGCVIQTFFRNTEEVQNFSLILKKLSQERDYFENELRLQQNRYSLASIIGKSPGIEKLKDQILRASFGNSTVLIDGETGTGKELVAHSIHNLSLRNSRAMIKLNCSAIPLELAESELFGYEHGSFTGARSGGNLGKFELADKSTLFLDEIDQLSPLIQPKLLRALQEREIVKIGARKAVSVDVRIIAATNKSLFIKINCAAIPDELMESELFGYAQGAFTGANRQGKKGKFLLANKGTLFLDEINQLPLHLQPKLLRALQEKEIEPVGGTETIPVDCRIVSASNVPLGKLVKEGKFREDLFYRLNVVSLEVPPLRERKEDIPEIAQALRERLNMQLGTAVPGISEDAIERLKDYDWPGNVRELQNVIERAMNAAWMDTLTWEHFERYFINRKGTGRQLPAASGDDAAMLTLKAAKERAEREVIVQALAAFSDNKTSAADALGITRAMLYRKLEKYGIE